MALILAGTICISFLNVIFPGAVPRSYREFGDPADHPHASVRPDMACAVDRLEDRLLETVARQTLTLPPGMQRRWFNDIVASVATKALYEAAQNGELRELFANAGPTGGDLEMVTRILAELMDADNPALQAECMAFTIGLNVGGGESETEIARRHHVGKAAVSKRCIRIREAFDLPPSRGMKSDRARAVFSRRQTGKRARPAREDWPYAGFFARVHAQG